VPALFTPIDSRVTESSGLTIKIQTAGILSGAIGVALLVFAGWMAVCEYREYQRNLFFSRFFAPFIWVVAAITGLIGLILVPVAVARWVRAIKHPADED
jgi:hypothetical protein